MTDRKERKNKLLLSYVQLDVLTEALNLLVKDYQREAAEMLENRHLSDKNSMRDFELLFGRTKEIVAVLQHVKAAEETDVPVQALVGEL